MLQFGRQVRDELLWEYPIMSGAAYTYQQMASGREWKVSGQIRGVSRAVEALHDCVTYTPDGLVQHSFEAYLRRRSMDYIGVGRTLFYTPNDGSPMEYLDPTMVYYNNTDKTWLNPITGRKIPASQVRFDHPIPIGGMGYFMAPIVPVIPSAMLAWLIREHDKASADGRKIRDIQIVAGKELALRIQESIAQLVEIHAGKADPTKNRIPLVYTEADMSAGGSVSDLVASLGIAKIPEGFDRNGFEFAYVNEIAAALGLPLRHFWNSEKATNRALEEVQEARGSMKGPWSFVRTESRLINRSGYLKQFGSNLRMSFIEEVDVQSRETNAKVLKMYAEALTQFAAVFGGQVNGDAFLAWLQSEDILPADIDLVTDMGTLVQSDDTPSPTEGNAEGSSDPKPSALGKDFDELDYGEVSMDSSGRIIERRNRVYTAAGLIAKSLVSDPEFVQQAQEEAQPVTFESALHIAWKENAAGYFEKFSKYNPQTISSRLHIDPERIARLKPDADLSDDDYRLISLITQTLADE